MSKNTVLFRPWEKIDAGDRCLALETAAEIIFCDKSALVRSGEGWKPNYVGRNH
jgi:hypothetical protein